MGSEMCIRDSGAIHQILIKKQFTGTKAHAVQRTTAQFHPSPFNHVDELHRLTGTENSCTGGKGQAIYLRLFLDQFQRSQRS